MKVTRVLPIFLLGLIGFVPVAMGQEPQAAEGASALSPNQQAFLNLPEERRKDFAKSLMEAERLFQQKRIFESLEELGKASAVFQDSPELYNLRGSCYVEMRSFDKAMEQFLKADALTKDNPSVQFNMSEVLFVTKQWQKALEGFEKTLRLIPESNIALSRLVEFKILLCLKKVGRKDEAAMLAEKYDFLDDSPFHYYAKAALAYEDEKLVEAEEWLARAARIFQNPDILAPWQDTLVEFGYIKSFYGEETAE